MKGSKHVFSVVAKPGGVVALFISKQYFHKLFTQKDLKVRFGKRKVIMPGHQLTQTLRRDTPRATKQYPKTKEVKELLTDCIMNNELFEWFNKKCPDKIGQLMDCMYPLEVGEDVELITQGETSDKLYIIEKGRYRVTEYDYTGGEFESVKSLSKGCFG
eukprot:UN25869